MKTGDRKRVCESRAVDVNENAMMFTVDVEGDWGGEGTRAVQQVLPPFLDLLQHYSVKATFFVVGRLVSSVVDLLEPDGPHEVGSHGLTHTVLTRLTVRELGFEVTESKRVLEAEGYRVSGFRAPFFRIPAALPQLLADAGYAYDASEGSVYPSPRRRDADGQRWNTHPPIFKLGTSLLRDGITPFSLTYLRLYHPFGLRLVSPRARLFCCHLHELMDEPAGWQALPRPLRWLHRRNCGRKAWDILHSLTQRFGPRFLSCRCYLERAQQHRDPDIQGKG